MSIESGVPVPVRGQGRAFAAGHLGELTQIITPSLVEEVLALTRRTQRRVRKLPSRVTVYFVLALSLFSADGYLGVWAALTAGLDVEDVAPSEAALRQARRRVGSAPLAMLFDRLKGPVAGVDCSGAWWRGLRTVAWDGTGLQIADAPETAGFFGRKVSCHGPGSYPALKLSALVECGTRALVDVVFGPHDTPEPEQNAVLCRSLQPDMLVLADRASDGYPLMCKAVATRADLLWRIQNNRSLAVIHMLPDGSYLSIVSDVRGRDRLRYWARHPRPIPPQVEGVEVRVIDATVTATGADGSTRTGTLRLVTTLLDPHAGPLEAPGEFGGVQHGDAPAVVQARLERGGGDLVADGVGVQELDAVDEALACDLVVPVAQFPGLVRLGGDVDLAGAFEVAVQAVMGHRHLDLVEVAGAQFLQLVDLVGPAGEAVGQAVGDRGGAEAAVAAGGGPAHLTAFQQDYIRPGSRSLAISAVHSPL